MRPFVLKRRGRFVERSIASTLFNNFIGTTAHRFIMSSFPLPVSLRIRPAILLFGDSITEFGFGLNGKIGWASLLAAAYSRRADVLSRGFSGYNTKHALDVLPSILGNPSDESNAKMPLLFCTVFFGANDCSLPTARQHLKIEEFSTNIISIVSKIRR